MKKKIVSLCICAALLAVTVIGGTLAYFTDTTAEKENTFTIGKVDIELTETSELPVDAGDHYVAGDPTEKGFEYKNMVPGFTYVKQPKITVQNDSQDCFVFLKLDMTKYVSLINLMMLNENATDAKDAPYASTTAFVNALASDKALFEKVVDKWFADINHKDWQIMNRDDLAAAFETWITQGSGSNPTALTLVLGYIDEDPTGVDCVCKAGDEMTFMNGFTLPGTVTSEMLAEGAYANGNTDFSGMKMTFTGCAIQAEGFADITAAYNEMFN